MYEREENLQRVREYLQTMQGPARMLDREFNRFKWLAVNFLVRDGVLNLCVKTGMLPRRVLENTKNKREVLRKLHHKSGHGGNDGTYEKARLR